MKRSRLRSEASFRTYVQANPMSYYPGRVREYFLHPCNVGEVAEAAAVGDTGSLRCGAALRLSLQIDACSREISDAKFKAAGCGYLIAAASILTDAIKGMSLSEASALIENSDLEDTIDECLADIPTERAHCLALCTEALTAALDNYHRTAREEWTGEEALICTCFGVSEKSIERAIRTRSLRTIKEVTRACNAGGGCHSCHPLIEDILEDYWRTEGAGD
ncbi:MAG TPA: iron-sulfur cluster assembly scaffold protein [Pyrinomonadaceae bacterium]